ncbi:hypothetical protein M5689_019583 [Euphorbia peplus]|nr:hypothetical protein M5689_019583 [Euphorbia peplus]
MIFKLIDKFTKIEPPSLNSSNYSRSGISHLCQSLGLHMKENDFSSILIDVAQLRFYLMRPEKIYNCLNLIYWLSLLGHNTNGSYCSVILSIAMIISSSPLTLSIFTSNCLRLMDNQPIIYG